MTATADHEMTAAGARPALLAARRGLRGRGRPGPPGPDRARSTSGCTRSCTSTPRARWPRRRAVDARAPAARRCGPLAGVPVAVKDVLDHQGRADHCRLEDPRGLAAAVRRDDRGPGCARPAWCMLGKTNMDEFAMGSSTEYSAYGPTHNPWDLGPHPGRLRRRLGGVAGRLRGAAGDRHGHRRLDPPARRGHRHRRRQADLRRHVPLRARRVLVLSGHPGPCARTVEDAALLHAVIAGHDPRDSTSIPAPVPGRGRGRALGRHAAT